jgi:hypothetical protein
VTSTFNNFIASLGGPIRSFPPGLRQTYVETMKQFAANPDAQGFDQITTQDGFEDTM